jgi:ubiquinone/menaquinone biosynthesis C-methylase UbiE
MEKGKWPKLLPTLTPEQQVISNNFMQHWHEVLSSRTRYSLIEKFNHNYPIKYAPKDFTHTLEIGAGIGEHINYEYLNSAQKSHYVALELRENMATQIQTRYPEIQTYIADCQKPLAFSDNHFDRILAIHVLEHLPNLPATIKEMHRLCHKNHGMFSIVIPCEGGLAYTLARKISAQRIFEKRYKQSYRWFIEREHINKPREILEELKPYFTVTHKSFFPFLIPSINLNLCIGLTLKPRINTLS